jgi:hypothetical protein
MGRNIQVFHRKEWKRRQKSMAPARREIEHTTNFSKFSISSPATENDSTASSGIRDAVLAD